jgi:hypothetical protein
MRDDWFMKHPFLRTTNMRRPAGVSFLFADFPHTIDRGRFRPDGEPPRSTKSIGDRSEAAVLAALVKAGYNISIPFGENHRYDLLADDGEQILRVQVKTGKLSGDVIRYSCSSSHSHRGGVFARPYFGQVDIIAVFCPQNGKVYVLPEKEFVATRAHLRLSEPANNQRRSIRWAREFELA